MTARDMTARELRIRPPDVAPVLPEPPVDRGRLLEAHEVSQECYHGKRSPRWVREHLRHLRAKVPGRPLWWEVEIRAELERTPERPSR